ncbi:MAG: hypothetical protein Q7J64_02660 [Elusimicrobiota bacterium]|nr:hypothetical protein [Elusimicrobiota bacterium]
MSYRLKRIDPFWLKSPALPAIAAVCAAVALFAAQTGRGPVALVAATASAAAIVVATKPALSAVFATFGLLGGLVTFLAGPSGGLSPLLRVLATAGFSVFYMVLMDAVVLAVSLIYNGFTRAGLPGLRLDLDARA